MKTGRIRLLCLIANLESGMGASLINALKYLSPRYEVIICEFMSTGSTNKLRARECGARVIELGKRGVDPAIVPVLVRVARDVRPQIVQGFELETNFYACTLGTIARAPAVATFHGLISAFRWSKLPFLQPTLWSANRIVCVSRAIAERCRARAPWLRARLLVIPNGVDITSQTPRRSGPRVGPLTIVYIANFYTPLKGHEHLVRAVAMLPDTRLWLVGSGELLDNVKQLSATLGIRDRVTFWGHRDDVARLLAESDVFVLPSLTEGCPMALLEAMAAGLPVVATDIPGVREIMSGGVHGLIVPPSSPEAIRDALLELAKDDRLCVTLGEDARRRVQENFRAEMTATRYEEVYAGIAGHP